jgi:hypothetical protein
MAMNKYSHPPYLDLIFKDYEEAAQELLDNPLSLNAMDNYLKYQLQYYTELKEVQNHENNLSS